MFATYEAWDLNFGLLHLTISEMNEICNFMDI